jgi:GTP cyclohydrolase I
MKTITSTMRGRFGDHDRLARSEFLSFIQSSL